MKTKNKNKEDELVEEGKIYVLSRLNLNRQNNKDKFPVLVGEVDALRPGLQERQPQPRTVGLQRSEASLKPCEKGTSFFTTGYSEELEIPGQSECSESSRGIS